MTENSKGLIHLAAIFFLAVVTILAFLFYQNRSAEPPTGPDNSSPTPFETSEYEIPENYKISLQYAAFDTRKGDPNLPPDLRYSDSSIEEEMYYIVQFTGPIMQEWQDFLDLNGFVHRSYIPNNAYLIKLDESQVDFLDNYEHIQWIGLFHPAYKIRPGSENHKTQIFTVMSHAPGDPELVIQDVKNLGGEVYEHWGGEKYNNAETFSPYRYRIKIDTQKLKQIAFNNEVFWIEPFVEAGINPPGLDFQIIEER